jgi:hypothetical protein
VSFAAITLCVASQRVFVVVAVVVVVYFLIDCYPSIRLGKFPIQNGMKQGDALSPLLFSFALEYAIRKIRQNQVGLELNVTHQLMVYADDINLICDSINTIKEKTETLLMTSRDVCLEMNAEKTNHMIMSRQPNSGRNQSIANE